MSDSVQLTIDQRGIATITVSRPQVRNALNREAMQALDESVRTCEDADDLRAVIVCGAQGTFISGGDLYDLQGALSEEDGLRQHDLMSGVLARLSGLPVPVIAAIEGAARGGGCEVALACDLRVMAEDASLGFAQIRMAVTPGWGGAGRLHELVGYSQALDLLLTGRVVSADEAHLLGLANYVCPAGRALHMATMLAERFAEGPALANRAVKEVLNGWHDLPEDAARAREREAFGRTWGSGDHAEASAAFIEKREPDFGGE